jgi:translation initiation factor IF-1
MLEITAQPDGEKIKSLRRAKKWTQEELSERVAFNKRTIENAEAGKRIKETYLERIAQALGVSLKDIVVAENYSSCSIAPESNSEGSGEVLVQTGTTQIELVINRDFNTYSPSEQARLLAAIQELLTVSEDIRVVRKRRGSVRLTLALTPEQAEKLLWAVRGGQLLEFGVVGAELAHPEEPRNRREEFLDERVAQSQITQRETVEEPVLAQGKVVATLSTTQLRVRLVNGEEVIADMRRKTRKNFLRILPGDIVTVKISPYDLNKGRIVSHKPRKRPQSPTDADEEQP